MHINGNQYANVACYLINRVPCRGEELLAQEIWSNVI